MSVVEDTIVAAFAITGWNKYKKTLEDAANLQDELARREKAFHDLRNSKIRYKGKANDLRFMAAGIGSLADKVRRTQGEGFLAQAQMFGAALVALSMVVYRASQAFSDLYNQVLNVSDITGSGVKASHAATVTARALGINDSTFVHDLLNLNRSMFQGKGQSALARLGVPADPTMKGLTLLNKIAEKLEKVPEGQRKTRIMQDLLSGGGGASVASFKAILPLLRMTSAMQEESKDLAATFLPDAARKSQLFAWNLGLIKESFMGNVVNPIIDKVMPAINSLMGMLNHLLNWWGNLDRATHGLLSWLATINGYALVFGTMVLGVTALVKALVLLNGVLKITATLQALIAAMSGNGAAIAMVVGAGIAIGGGIYAYDAMSNPGANSPEEKFGEYVDKFGAAVDRMEESYGGLIGNGIPRGIASPADVDAIGRRMALGAIG